MYIQRRIAHHHEASKVQPEPADVRFQRTSVNVKDVDDNSEEEDPEQLSERMEAEADLEDKMSEIENSNPLGDPIDSAETKALEEEIEAAMEEKKEEAMPKKPSELTPAKMQAIEAELSSVMSGMMTSVVSNILTQEPRIVRLAKRQRSEL